MYAIKIFILFFSLHLGSQVLAQEECEKIFKSESVVTLAQLENCRDLLDRESLRNERPVFQIRLEQDLVERMIFVLNERESCYKARNSFFRSYGIKNMEEPHKDMGPDLLSFWRSLQKICPEL